MKTHVRKQIFRSLLLIAACFLTNLTVSAQWGQGFDSVSIGNLNARFYADGLMFYDKVGNPKFEAPQGSGKHSMFAGGFWIGGLDGSSQLHLAATTYQQSGRDYWPGPAGTTVPLQVSNPADSTYLASFDRVWKITRAEIDAFKADFAVNQSISNPALYPNVFSWPAFSTDPYNNTHALAPFVDVDGNPNAYNPAAGDYPLIRGDEMLWWVFNDRAGIHTESGGQAMGLEFHASAYAFDCNNGPVPNSIFLNLQIVNRSTITYSDVYSGMWTDIDVGMFSDDYVGSDSLLNMTFGYNGDADDETPNGYGLNPPAIGTVLLRGPEGPSGFLGMTNSQYYENDFSNQGNPEQPIHFYNYMRSIWKDGSHVVNNGLNGYPGTATGPQTNYMYTGDPGFCGGPSSGWSEVSANNQPFDRRILQSSGPYTFPAGGVKEIEYAFVYARANVNDNLGSVCALKSAVNSLQNLYAFNALDCTSPDSVWPGDANYDLVADAFDLLPIGYAYGSTGPLRPSASINWQAQASYNWGQVIPNGYDYMHVDCDGDGSITAADTLAIQQNYGLTHNKGGGFSRTRIDDPPLYLEFEQDTFLTGDTVVAWLIYGDSTYPADSVLSLAARFAYDNSLVDTNTISVTYPNSWLGTRGVDMLTLSHDDYQNGIFDIALCRTDQVHLDGYGRLARVSFITIDNISTKLNAGVFEPLSFRLTRYDIRDNELQQRPANPKLDSLIVNDPEVGRTEAYTGQVRIYPNPAQDLVKLRIDQGYLEQVQIRSLTGQLVFQQKDLHTREQKFNTSKFPRGVYFLTIKTDQGSLTSKLILH